jgi:hypothetical protein
VVIANFFTDFGNYLIPDIIQKNNACNTGIFKGAISKQKVRRTLNLRIY